MVRSGEITDYAQLARLGHISPARLTQIMVLLHLAPAIQEYILFLSPADARLAVPAARSCYLWSSRGRRAEFILHWMDAASFLGLS
jgi:hypothetical protein